MDGFRVGNWAKSRKKEELHDDTVELHGYGKFKGIENHPKNTSYREIKREAKGNGVVKNLSSNQCKIKTNRKYIALRR